MTISQKRRYVSPKFAEWIKQYGDTKLAAELGVSQVAVINWRTGRSRPDPTRLTQLLALAVGVLSASDIYATAPAATPRRRRAAGSAKRPSHTPEPPTHEHDEDTATD